MLYYISIVRCHTILSHSLISTETDCMQIEEKQIQELLVRAKDGDSEAFGTVYESYVTQIYRYIYFRVKDKDIADDLTQSVFIKIFAHIDQIDPEYPRAYFFTVTRNLLADHWKKKKDILFNESDEEFKLIPSEDNIVAHIDTMQEMNRVRGFLHKLKDEQREALTLRFMHELSTKEIAEIMDKEENTVRQLQCRGLKTLREYLVTNH